MRLKPELTQYWLRQKTLPYFKLYLAERKKEDLRAQWKSMLSIGFLGLPMVVFASMILRHEAPLLFGVIPIGLIAGGFALRTHYERSNHRAMAAYLDAYQARDPQAVHRYVDATAQELLEAGSFFWYKIHTLLAASHASARLSGISGEARTAADQAMDELAALCSNCMGEPVNKRGNDIKEAFVGLAEGNIKGALRDFSEVLNPDSERYKVHSPHIDVVYRPARALAEKLQALSTEIERLSSQALDQKHQMVGAVSSIDSVLYAIQATRAAETELETDQRIGQE